MVRRVVTVGTYSNGVGFTDSSGALTDNSEDQTIPIASGGYTVSSVVVLASPAGALVMGLDPRFPTGDEETLVFHIGSSTFKVSAATFEVGVGYSWQNSGLSWSVGDMVVVRLRRSTDDDASTNNAPSFTSSTTFNPAENQTAAGTVRADDSDTGDTVTGYAITGGADMGFFSIGATSGVLTFNTAPNFEDARDQDAGNTYEVTVQATGGTGDREQTATQAITVTVRDDDTEAPAAPDAPSVSAASVTSLSVTWPAPDNAGPAITDYDYRYRTTSPQGEWMEVTDTTVTALSATIAGLAENTSYDVQVRAINDEGTGGWSASGSGATDADANAAPAFTSSATFDAAENQTAAGTVRAQDSDADDTVTGYAITGGADMGFFSIGAASGVLTFKTAPNFEDAQDQGAGNTYEVTVQATGGTGDREQTATQAITVTVRDDNNEAPGAPDAPSVSAASVTSLSVTWPAPDNAGPEITDYDYRHRTTSPQGAWMEVADTMSTALSVTIAGLAENTSYDVQVRATNDEGTGGWSASGSGATDANAAPAFTSSETFGVEENGTAAGTVEAEDSDAGDAVTGYAITGGADMGFFSIGPTSGVLVFKTAPNFEDPQDADNGNTYEVTVQATSGTGDRVQTATQAITATVGDDKTEAPGAPAAPSVSAASVTSLTVTWPAPDNDGPEITDYDYRHRTTSPQGAWMAVTNTTITVLSATIAGLAENTSYDVQVRATNDEGTGGWSASGSGATDANAAPAFTSSETFGVEENGTAAGTVEAEDSDAGDAVTGYAITGGADMGFFSIGPTSGVLVFKTAPNFEDPQDQGAGNTYLVTVQATSGAGDREQTATQAITVTVRDADEKPDKPAKPTLAAVPDSSTSLTARWTKPGLNGGPDILNYTLRYRQGTSGEWVFAAIIADLMTSATITGLMADTKYQVQVAANNGELPSGWSDPSDAVNTTGGICDRTPRVRDRILVLLKNRHSFKGGCGDVGETHLGQLESLDLGRNPSTESAFTMSLRSNDFEGLVNLKRLYLRETGLSSLPAGVFSGLAALETLELDNNQLSSLPPGVFSDLHSLQTLQLQKNPQLISLPYDEFEALPKLTNLRIDQVGRHKLQVAGGDGDVTLEVAAGGSVTYAVRLMAAPDFRITAENPLKIEVMSSDMAGVVATPAELLFTKENWFRRQTVTVGVMPSASGTAELAHEASGTTMDSQGNQQSNYDFEAYPLPTVTVRVLESDASRSDDPLTAAFEGLPEAHDGESAFSFRIAFSEAVAVTPEAMRTRVLTVAGGVVNGAARVDGESGVWAIEVTPDTRAALSITLAPAADCEVDGAVCTADGRPLSIGAAHIVSGPAPETHTQEEQALTASFEGLPEAHDGEDAFRFRVAFSEDIGIAFRSMRDASFTVSGGEVTGARRVDGRHDLWEITVEPGSGEAMTIALPAGRECGVSGAICTRGGNRRQLANTATATVAGPVDEAAAAALTASFVQAPAEHDGSSRFKLRIGFSEGISIGFRTFRDQSLSVSGGSVTKAKRVEGRRDLWEVTVKPGSLGDVTVTLEGGRACGTAGAVCTGDGRALSATILTTVLGPVALSVVDARVDEALDATLDFAVTLSRASSGTVAVAYATADGSATAGSDYTATSGTLTFAAGETSKTVSVPVLDDAHDEGEETLMLRLSAATGAVIADGEATGTIENTDHMPAAWLARFGRTVTDQVLEAVEARLAAPRAAGVRATLAGQALPSWDGANDNAKAAAGDNADASDREAMTAIRDWMAHAGAGGEWRAPGEGPEGADLVQSRALTGRDILTGTSFALTGGSAEAGGYAALWGRGAISRFDGREGDLTLDGEVTTGLMGADWATERWTAGLAVGHARGTGGYREGGGCEEESCAGEVEATLTGVWPYAGLTLTDRVSAWAAAGYGAGELKLMPGGESPFTADLTMAMGAAGMRGELLTPPPEGGLALALKGDARFTRTASEATKDAAGVGNLAAATADGLVRTGIEGSRRFAPGGDGAGLVLTPSFEIGVRLDGGDAETGLGVDLGGGLAFAAPKQGIALDLKARGLVAHQAAGFREWGASASLAWDPRPSTDRGLALTLRQSWGGSPTGGMDALLGRETLAGLAANDNGDTTASAGRLEAELGYGIAMFSGGFTGTPHLGVGLTETGRDYRLGWRLTSARRGDPGFEIGLDATRSEAANADAEHGIALRGTIRW